MSEPDPYERMARLVASRLTPAELVELANLLDEDADGEFCFRVQAETYKIKPELYVDPKDYDDKSPTDIDELGPDVGGEG